MIDLRQGTVVGVAIFLVAYVGLSGPIAGGLCYAARHDIDRVVFYSEALEWHLTIYQPLWRLAFAMGLGEVLEGYWEGCGWSIPGC